MNIDSVNNYKAQGVTFGYKMPVSADVLANFAYKIKVNEGQAAYDEYIGVVKSFVDKRFDATKLVDKYLPEIKKYGEKAYREFKGICRKFEVPEIVEYKDEVVTKEITKKQQKYKQK